ncbi:MAG: right-handed parallel beta-helix repeat-containing protein [Chitinophagaceae bacterium]|nr:right-handed parallel beta-helix repeat-containing protein [Chitinophagaceae bacterium]
MQLLKNACFFIILLLPTSLLSAANPPVELKPGMIITSSLQVKRAIYQINGYDSLNRPVIFIKGDNITVDFNNALLQGSIDKQLPNSFYGLAILIRGNNITLKNAKISGYKVAVMAEGCKNLTIENADFSYNYRQQLQSTWLHEDVSDWMSYHHNENDEWLRYGAGIYLKDCNNSIIKNNTITGGQCALMMMRCNDGEITDNDFSFNSAIGIGMYRSSRNNILHNKLDFNVRGYSHGFYNRGQDSAGILIFEQCNDNVFAYNSVTHGGDGFFLWAGQTTMDTGAGGCNNNYVYKNDFSYAPTNGVEITFSKNNILENIIKECDHGIWGGYSWNTSIYGNQFYKNRIGIAIEHGQHINISGNTFDSNKQAAIKIWARNSQPADWGYAQKRNTKSMNYSFWQNRFKNENTAFDLTLTNGLTLYKNTYENTKTEIKKDSSVQKLVINPADVFDSVGDIPPIIESWQKKDIPVTSFAKGRKQIRITEWGPYDNRYPILFLKKIDSNQVYYFDVLGPKGKWKIQNSKDLTNISINEGSFPAALTAKQAGTDVQLNLSFTGEAFTDQFGKKQGANTIHTFSFRDFQPNINWSVNWYSWDSAHNPNKNYDQFKTVYNNTPVRSEQATKIDYTWWGAIGKNLPADSFAIAATGVLEVEKGLYELHVTADDLVKVFVDDKLMIDFWDVSRYKYDEDTHHTATVNLNGKHTIRIEQVENSGYATLIFKLIPLKNKL